MADRFYSVTTFGDDHIADVVEAATTQASVVELRVTYDGANNSRLATLRAMEAIAAAITKDTWPPA